MSRDIRRYAQQTNFRLIIGGILFFIIIGIGLIYIIYGKSAAVMGLICLGAGIVPLLIILLIFAAMEWIIKHADKN